jgi:hypothetical protein
MKTRATEQTADNHPYPCLKRFTESEADYVVLFTNENAGFVVHVFRSESKCCKVGDSSGYWTEHRFEPFQGVIELSN